MIAVAMAIADGAFSCTPPGVPMLTFSLAVSRRLAGTRVTPNAMMNGTHYGASGTPDAIAHAAVYLASDESAFATGNVYSVDGGMTI